MVVLESEPLSKMKVFSVFFLLAPIFKKGWKDWPLYVNLKISSIIKSSFRGTHNSATSDIANNYWA